MVKFVRVFTRNVRDCALTNPALTAMARLSNVDISARERDRTPRHRRPGTILVASDFDQTLSFNDSGTRAQRPHWRVGLRRESRGPRAQQPRAAGRRAGVPDSPRPRASRRAARASRGNRTAGAPAQQHPALVDVLSHGIDGHRFSFFVISAAPREVIQSALEGIVAPRSHHRHRAGVRRSHRRGARRSAACRPATARSRCVEELEARLGVAPDRSIYVGDGSSDVHVMLHVNNRAGHTIAVSENQQLARIAKSTVLERRCLERDGADPGNRAAAGTCRRSARCSSRPA